MFCMHLTFYHRAIFVLYFITQSPRLHDAACTSLTAITSSRALSVHWSHLSSAVALDEEVSVGLRIDVVYGIIDML